ncbi:MAG: hypothetical protein HY563_04200 [Ignavibacteriales bacterium]|nr:hypothetical protein [Ignavibacteriales bacterium]
MLSQFTEKQTSGPAAAEEPAPQESAIFEQPVVETQPPEQSFVEQAPPGQSEDVFGISAAEGIPAGQEPPEPAAEQIQERIPPQPSESFEEFSERKRVELFGLENSMSLEEYLGEKSNGTPSQPVAESPSAETPPAEDPFAALTQYEEQQSPATPLVTPEETVEDPFAQLHQAVEEQPEETKTSVEVRAEEPKDHIEELAEKLKDAKKITPVINLSDHTITPSSEADTPSGTGFVTPTLAEIYAKQGWYEDAIKAYKTLAATKPAEREKYESRIRELEEEKKKQEGG